MGTEPSGRDQNYYRKNWTKASEEKPRTPYDLCLLRDVNGRVQPGWWTGKEWDYGLRKIIKEVYEWKREQEFL
jgi:hypothetical protein